MRRTGVRLRAREVPSTCRRRARRHRIIPDGISWYRVRGSSPQPLRPCGQRRVPTVSSVPQTCRRRCRGGCSPDRGRDERGEVEREITHRREYPCRQRSGGTASGALDWVRRFKDISKFVQGGLRKASSGRGSCLGRRKFRREGHSSGSAAWTVRWASGVSIVVRAS